MLYDSRELNTAKQAQSAVHQYGREGMLSELYGVTGWEFDFRGNKLAGDWQAALGVTVRVHHLTWTSMAGEAKRDYPASIGYQSPWYKEYPLIENYFSRLNTVLSRGKAVVKVGVIHPIESYWLYWGTKEQTQGLRDEMDERFKKLTEWLLFGLIDFDFISESLWKSQTPDDALLSDEAFSVGKMKYETILVPNCLTLRSSTLERLKVFQKKGGRVVFLGELPRFIDAIPSDEAEVFSESCEKIHFAKENVLNVLQKERLLDVHDQSGMRTANLIYQLREEKDREWLFFAHCNAMPNPDLPKRENLVIEINGIYEPVRYDAMTGECYESVYFHKEGKTVIRQTVYDHDSLLYSLKPAAEEKEDEKTEAAEKEYEELELESYLDAELAEPNVLVLDLAEVKVEEEPWQKEEEILRLDNKLRERFGYPKREEAFPQPWVMAEKDKESHLIQLRFKIFSDIEAEKTALALEEVKNTRLFLNGEEISTKAEGYYVDRSIAKVPLPRLHRGENILIAQVKYSSRVNLEAMYLLGDFGVKLAGKNTRLIKAEEKMAFGDVRSQGLPFYGGNLTYKTSIDIREKCDLKIEITRFKSPLLKVFLDGKDCGAIAFSPYALEIRDITPGKHRLEIEFFGNRYNTFGALHNCNETLSWKGHPNSYRTVGEAWSYEYQIHPQGILKAPVIKIIKG